MLPFAPRIPRAAATLSWQTDIEDTFAGEQASRRYLRSAGRPGSRRSLTAGASCDHSHFRYANGTDADRESVLAGW